LTIELKDVSKRFGRTQALDRVSLQFGGDKIYGLLGNNGAGKSTLLNIVTSRYFADSGEITMGGEPLCDNDRGLSQIYMLGEKNYYPDDMRVNDALHWAAMFYANFDKAAAKRLSERFQLPPKKKITALSTGYQSIFRIVVALSVNTPFLLLDEPVLGLDARHRDMFYKTLIERYSENPCTIVVSTHLIAEMSRLIEHCMIIRDGRIVKDAPCEVLLSGGYNVSGPSDLLDAYLLGKKVLSSSNLGGLKTACLSGEMPLPADLPTGLEVGKMDLQEYFIELMNDGSAGGNLQEGGAQ
jgi:ABC-2 type transport system ATP-binding protein